MRFASARGTAPECSRKSSSSGAPNVGKSTLFNRLIGKRLALVDDQPGVTRDRRFGEAHLLGLDFTAVDTAGWEDEDPASLPGRMRAQTEISVQGASVALFVIDARAGVTPLDEEVGRWLREQDVPVVLVANKAEGAREQPGDHGGLCAGPGRARSRSRPSTARAWPICSRRCCR